MANTLLSFLKKSFPDEHESLRGLEVSELEDCLIQETICKISLLEKLEYMISSNQKSLPDCRAIYNAIVNFGSGLNPFSILETGEKGFYATEPIFTSERFPALYKMLGKWSAVVKVKGDHRKSDARNVETQYKRFKIQTPQTPPLQAPPLQDGSGHGSGRGSGRREVEQKLFQLTHLIRVLGDLAQAEGLKKEGLANLAELKSLLSED